MTPEMRDEPGHFRRQPLEPRLLPIAALVHVERPVDLDLQGMAAAPRVAVMSGGEPAGIRRVERDRELSLGEKGAGRLDDARRTRRAIAVAEHDIRAVRTADRARRRRHRMAIEQEIAAEIRRGLVDETPQRVMIGLIERLDPLPRLGKAQLPGIDLLAAGDHPGNRAEPHAHPGRAAC